MPADPNLASVAALIGDPTRAAMLASLLGGKALTAGELARSASVTPQTASAHLSRLCAGGLLQMVAAGRHRYYQLAGPEIAQVLEALARIAPAPQVTSLRQSEAVRHVRFARMCYDHLAGTVGVAITERLLEQRLLTASDSGYALTSVGYTWMETQGLDPAQLKYGRRAQVRPCLDWSERRHHVAGAFGALLAEWMLSQGWFQRLPNSRALQLTSAGRVGLAHEWELTFPTDALS